MASKIIKCIGTSRVSAKRSTLTLGRIVAAFTVLDEDGIIPSITGGSRLSSGIEHGLTILDISTAKRSDSTCSEVDRHLDLIADRKVRDEP